jgi:hypothetical protein
MDVPQREFWDGHPVPLGHGVVLRKRRGDRNLEAVFRLQSHQLGFEMFLEVNGLLSRSQVCRSSDDVIGTFEHWRNAMLSTGWSE